MSAVRTARVNTDVKDTVDRDFGPLVGEVLAGDPGLFLAGLVEIDVDPTRKAVLRVPGALSVAKQHELGQGSKAIARRSGSNSPAVGPEMRIKSDTLPSHGRNIPFMTVLYASPMPSFVMRIWLARPAGRFWATSRPRSDTSAAT